MNDILHCPPNLAALGVKRQTKGNKPDLITIWKTPYPVLTNYKKLCNDLSIDPFAGGTYREQGQSYKKGYITSGYRLSGDAKNSPHPFAVALDVIFGGWQDQIKAARVARKYFTRVGFYPDRGFLHLDQVPIIWMKKYGGKRHWVCIRKKYTSFDTLDQAIYHINEIYK